mgnify:FL=1|tara:strand:- start:667 stop:942 length:276 start_codon:yes stop_codon:yes gene_type:complete
MKNKVKVRNMMSNNGNFIPNQFEIRTNEGMYFQSYNSTIVFIDNNGKVFLDENDWDYSRTTGKYRNIFLGENMSETRKKIKTGEYKLKELN